MTADDISYLLVGLLGGIAICDFTYRQQAKTDKAAGRRVVDEHRQLREDLAEEDE